MEYDLFLCVLYTCIATVTCEYCSTGIWSTTYCHYGCCGRLFDQHCCQYNLGLYIGIGVTSSVVFVAVVIVFLIYLCKKNTHPGRVVNIAAYRGPNIATLSRFSSSDGRFQTHTTMFPQQPSPMYPPPPGPAYSGGSYHPAPGGVYRDDPPPVAHPLGYTPMDSKPPPYT